MMQVTYLWLLMTIICIKGQNTTSFRDRESGYAEISVHQILAEIDILKQKLEPIISGIIQ